MGFKEKLNKADTDIKGEYEKSVVSNYTPIFDALTDKADKHMKENDLSEIELNIHSGLSYSGGRGFFKKEKDTFIGLLKLAEIYQKEADYIAVGGDSRHYTTPTIAQAMRNAAEDFRNQLLESIAETV